LVEHLHFREVHAAVVGVYFPDLLVSVVEKIKSVANGQLWQRVYFAVEKLFRHVCKVVGGSALYLRSEWDFALEDSNTRNSSTRTTRINIDLH
jgi:hypothetical protein